MAACYFIIMQILFDEKIREETNATVPHNGWDINQFFLSYGTILFTYGGASTFPTIQNDMYKKNEYSRTVIGSFISEFTYKLQCIHLRTIIFSIAMFTNT